MAILEIFLSAFVSTLFDKMASGELWDFVRQEGIDDQFDQWKQTLSRIQAVLADAEKKQQTETEGVKLWLEDLQDLTYDLDDLVDEFSTEVLKRKLTAETRASTSKVWNFIPTCCTNYKPSAILFNAQMKSKIAEITSRIDKSFNQSLKLNLEMIVGTASGQSAWRRPETTSLLSEPKVYGRERETKRIIELLLKDDSSQSKFGVIPLVGMGGVGKTTLAQSVYSDETVKEHFDLKAWVCVSDEFDVMRITKVILESMTSGSGSFTSLDQVQVALTKALTGKKFLIVLDDIWNKNYGNWITLNSPFNHGAQGSKVLVTTRDKDIAGMMGTVEVQEVGLLSHEDCELLLAQHAFGNKSKGANPKLVSIGKEIAKKCGGLPLAARTIGGLLRCKEREDEWEAVLRSSIWKLPKDENDIAPALRLSYLHLPPNLKQCFAYCAILPKDYEFEENELILLWMAEGFIQQQTGQQMEEVAAGYFQELVSRSFFQPSGSKFVMHDLISDLAREVGRNSCFRLEDLLKDEKQHGNLMRARHASYLQGYDGRHASYLQGYDGMEKFETFSNAKHLRTLLPFSLKDEFFYVTRHVPLDLLPKLSYLRELSLRKYNIEEIPSSIGNLKHLRFIDLSYSHIGSLPDSIGGLYNLQTLKLKGCRHLNKISFDVGRLINLRHLSLPSSLKEMPQGIGKLTSLQTLSHFIITERHGSRIKELGDLNHLGGTLRISGLENLVDVEAARDANLKDKPRLKKLSMLWRGTSNELQGQSVGAKVFAVLRPPKNLREVLIRGYHGIRFPDWMGDPLFSKMETVRLESCRNCTSLPQLGRLPVLKKVSIKGMTAVRRVGPEFYGQDFAKSFPLLEELSFMDMQEWKDWQTTEDVIGQPFACVSKLVIENCPILLSKLPGDLPCLKTLMIKHCPQLQVEVSKLNYPSLTSLSMNDVPFPIFSVDEMGKVLGCASLASLDIGGFPIPNYLANPVRDDEIKLENIVCKHSSVGNNLEIKNVQKLDFFPKWFTQVLTKVEKVSIRHCDDLLTLWKNYGRLHHSRQGLRSLVIEKCNKLVSLFDGEEYENKGQEQQQPLEVLPRLEILSISNCEKFEILPRGLHNFMSLGELTIFGCHNLVNFPVHGFPCTLRKLVIHNCDALQCFPGWNVQNNNTDTDSHLEELEVMTCKSLEYLIGSSGGLPPTLRNLFIWKCKKMVALLQEEKGLVNLPCIENFRIYGCESLKFLPDANLHNNNGSNNLRRLTNFRVADCVNLGRIPQAWSTLPANLEYLIIDNWDKLVQEDLFSNANFTCLKLLCIGGGIEVSCLTEKGDFLSNLTALEMVNMNTGTPPSKWDLHKLSSLKHLYLVGPIVIVESEWKQMEVDQKWSSFPFHGMSLPTSLVDLSIAEFKNLEAVSPEFLHLTSLEYIGFSECPMLAYFPKQRFPRSLLKLRIGNCPKLEEKCQKGKGEYWPFIDFIPKIETHHRRERPRFSSDSDEL